MKANFKRILAAMACAASLFTLSIDAAQAAKAGDAKPQNVELAQAAAPAGTATATAPVAMADAKSPVAVENPYGLEALWSQGDIVAKGTLLIMILMSMGTWYILVTKLVEQGRLLKGGRNLSQTFWGAGDVGKGIAALPEGDAYRFVAETALKSAQEYNGPVTSNIDFNTWSGQAVDGSVGRVNSSLQTGMSFLATVGSTSPFIGLFGTVWGIYHALTAIALAGQASIDKVAGPVGEALIMTAIGLAVAVPAVLGYNWLVRRNKLIMEQVRGFGAQLHAAVLKMPVGNKH